MKYTEIYKLSPIVITITKTMLFHRVPERGVVRSHLNIQNPPLDRTELPLYRKSPLLPSTAHCNAP